MIGGNSARRHRLPVRRARRRRRTGPDPEYGGHGLSVLTVSRDFTIWTDGLRAWWRDEGTIHSHRTATPRDLRRAVFQHFHQRREPGSSSVDDVRAAAERLRGALLDHGLTRQEMDLFPESRVAVAYVQANGRLNVTVAGGHYTWPGATAPWTAPAAAAAEIAHALDVRN